MGSVQSRDQESISDSTKSEPMQEPSSDKDQSIDLPEAQQLIGGNLESTPTVEIPDVQVCLNVGGQRYSTTTSTLARDEKSHLAQMLTIEENWEKIRRGEELFIDRDGQYFGHILNYLRDDDQMILPMDDSVRGCLIREAEFFNLDGLARVVKCAQNMKIAVSTLKTKPVASVKILILGDSGVGKTSILEQYCDGMFNMGQASTIGVDYRTKLHSIEGKTIKFYFWDTSGQEKFRAITRSYYRGSKGVIFVYDVTSRASFMQLSKWIKEFDSNNGVDGGGHFPKILAANKIDLEATRVISAEEGVGFALKNFMTYVETSAKTKMGVQRAFEEVVQQVLQTPTLWEELDKDAKRILRHGNGMGRPFYVCC